MQLMANVPVTVSRPRSCRHGQTSERPSPSLPHCLILTPFSVQVCGVSVGHFCGRRLQAWPEFRKAFSQSPPLFDLSPLQCPGLWCLCGSLLWTSCPG